ncbi:MAG: PSD1 and planctomycete cytochrome C domain-containing protein [Planctomycetota bacterium]
MAHHTVRSVFREMYHSQMIRSLSVTGMPASLSPASLWSRSCASLALIALGVASVVAPAQTRAEDAADTFHQKVEPILRRHCYACHSHASGQMESGLSLDWKSGWVTGGDRGPAIVPMQPEASLLIRAIEHSDAELKMPEEKLHPDDIAILIAWVRQGAFDDRTIEPQATEPTAWWSLRPLIAPPIPKSPNTSERGLQENPIDAFIEEKLINAGLSISTPASSRDLIRRLSYDLVGLPPSPEDVEAFAADPSPEAYRRWVDRLLDSPRYGERWARHWMDTIHFADSHGYEHDVGRDNAWPYRDYLIQSLNQDVPWSQWIRQQLAVDVFEPEATDRMPALGFLGAGTFDLSTYSTGPVTFDYLDRDDLVTQTMAAFLSTTANCARCHAHKFDPIAQEDYYALQAIFSGIVKGDIPYDADRAIGTQRRQWIAMRDAALARQETALKSELAQKLIADWVEARGEGAVWQPLDLQSYVSMEGSTLTKREDESLIASGPSPNTDVYVLTGSSPGSRITALRLELLPDDSLPMQGPGRCQNGNLHLSEVLIRLFEPSATEGRSIRIARATADFNQEGWGVERAIDGDNKTAWGIHPAVGQPHQAIFEFEQPVEIQSGTLLTVTLKQLHGGSHLIGAFRLSATDGPPGQAIPLPLAIETSLKRPSNERSSEEQLAIAAHIVRLAAEAELAKLPPPSKVFAAGTSVSIPTGNGKDQAAAIAGPKVVHLFQRGDINKPQQVVGPGALSVLQHTASRFDPSVMEKESSRRAALADWIAHPENVLTWRSAVNRVWHYHFGKGLCDTPSDFGRMGGVPSHTELIDWLAVWFRDDARGSLKELHRLIVTSRTYQQRSDDRPDAAEIDAENRLLWRQNRMRLDADAFRDYVLAFSGRLEFSMGGPAIQQFHQQPGPQSTPKLDYAVYDWSSPGSNRRSIYRYVWRGIPDPMMSALDFPDLGLLAPVRGFSASPLQSLALYNNPFVLHHSQVAAARINDTAKDSSEAVRQTIRWAYQRDPTEREQATFQAYTDEHGLAALCRVIINSNEFMFIP